LYFQKRLAPTRSGASTKALGATAAVVAAIALSLLLPPVRASVAAAASQFRTRVVDPLHAEEYTRWGMHSVESGQLSEATHYFMRASQLAPEDQRLKSWLRKLSQVQQQPEQKQP
jgi:hypothetical protein